MVVWVLGWMLGLISGTTKFMSNFVKYMAQNNLCQISLNLWQNCCTRKIKSNQSSNRNFMTEKITKLTAAFLPFL
jgi:hypothetical protein